MPSAEKGDRVDCPLFPRAGRKSGIRGAVVKRLLLGYPGANGDRKHFPELQHVWEEGVNRLEGAAAVVTGGGQGLGEATARLFGREGAKVIVADINEAAAKGVAEDIVAEGGSALAIRADIALAQDADRLIAETVERYGRVDVLVNNAGIARMGTVVDIDETDWDLVMAVNIKGAYLCSRAAIPHMERQGGGSIVCIASASGVIGQKAQVAYNVSKHGVIGLVRCMALDHAAAGIRVNAVCPGTFNTPMLDVLSEEQMANLRAMHPLGRVAEPAEIVQMVLHLASDEASFTTGSVILVDGGLTAG